MSKDVQLKELISKLANDNKLDKQKLEEYKLEFEKIYTDNYRHEYSQVTKVLFSIGDDEGRAFLASKIRDIGNSIDNINVKKRVIKLWDHVNLENIRLEELKKISVEANKAFTEVNDVKNKYAEIEERWEVINEQAAKVDDKLKEMNKDIDNSTAKSITILGIFSGIVMAFTGGLSFIASSLEKVNEVSIYRLVLVIILLSMAIFNIIFMLMYTIGRFTGSYLGGNCNCENVFEGCADKKIKCTVVRYPLASYFNIACSLVIMTLIFLYTIDRFNLITKLISYNIFLGIISLTLIFGIYLLVLVFIILKLSKIECEYEYFEPAIANIKYITQSFRGGYRKKDKYKK
ncbi:hypothetical protein H8S20_18170 [Clostridium sp. NSJ-6]|uniref:Uncharacterized protein n=1 Tax=Clostridium hominis TaxID=2763036 RepID=A0ABR7DIY1_9CLOT|nr:hypothetical protein [Clostridium hominis]MBC5630783.1 hypothetical protein [Clostridium hominis]